MHPELLAKAAQEAYASAHPDEAKRLCGEWIKLDPHAVAPHVLLAQVANRQEKPELAIQHYQDAYALAPEGFIAYNLAKIYRFLDRGDEATFWYEQTLQCHPDWLKPCLEMAQWLAGQHEYHRAAGVLLAAIRRAKPDDLEANAELHETHQLLVHMAEKAVSHSPVEGQASMPKLNASRTPLAVSLWSIVVCSIDPKKYATFHNTVRRCFSSRAYEVVHIDDAKSLSEGYNRGLAQSRGDVVLFCHDDIDFLIDDLPERLSAHLAEYDLIGVAGTTQVSGEAVFWSGHPWIHGWVIHRGPVTKDVYEPSFSSLSWPVVANAQALDGLFMACKRDVAKTIKFDEQTFDGFHLYDLDFSYRACLAGYRLAICCDLGIVHASMGTFDASWRKYADRFRTKFPELTGLRGKYAHFFSCRVKDGAQALAVHATLAQWLEN